MSNVIINFIKKDHPVTISDILITIFGFTLIRTFFENFSNPEPSGLFTQFYSVFFEYFLFYISTFLLLLISLHYFTKISIKKLAGILIFFLPIICVPPIIDLLITHGSGYCMSYIIQEPRNLLLDFLTFFGHFSNCGITTGIRTEVFIICASTFVLIFYTTKKFFHPLFGMFASYAIIFFSLAFPSLIMIPFYISNPSTDKIFFFSKLFKTSLLNSIHVFGSMPSDPYEFFMQQSAIFTARFLWILVVIELLTILYLAYRPVWNAWIRNLRPERVLYYSMIAIFGMSISYRVNGSFPVFTLPDIIAFIVFFILIALSFWLAVIINDIEDVEIDKISNPDRPLVTKNISIEQFKAIGFVILFLILMGTPLLNYPVFIFLVLFQFMYYIYSKKPLYLKRWFFLASPLLAFNALLIAMAGFFLISANQKILAFPIETIWFILIGFSIVTNIKDLKDTEGDKAAGIKTLPVILGQEKAKKIITIAAIIFILIFAVYKQNSYLIVSSVIISALFYLITSRKIFKEIYIFGLFFLYLIVIMLA